MNIPGAAFFKNMTWLPEVPMPVLAGSGEFTLTGSITLAQNMLVDYDGNIRFTGNETGNTISLADHWLNSHLNFRGTGTWTLNGPLRVTGENEIRHGNGALITNGHDIDAWTYRTINSSATPIPGWELHLGASHVHLRRGHLAWSNYSNGGLLLDAGTSVIELSGDAATFQAGNGYQYHDVRFTGTAGNCGINDNNGHFQRLSCGPGTGQFKAVGTVGDLILARGRSVQLIITLLGEITTTGPGDEYLRLNGTSITKTSGSLCLDKAIIQNVNTAGGAQFTAGRSLLLGTSTGWVQDNCHPDLLLDHTPLIICQGGEVTFMNASSGYLVDQAWQFEGGEPATSTDQSPTVTFAEPGSYSVNIVITYTDTIIASTLPEMVIVEPMEPIIVMEQGSGLGVNIADAQYQWIDCLDGTLIAGADAQEFIPTVNGEYAVQVITADGCNGISACYPFLTVGLPAADQGSPFQIFPNPNNGSFMVHLPNSVGVVSFVIMDATGKVILQNGSTSDREWVDLQAAPGLYIVQLRTDTGAFQQRLIIE